MLFMSIDVHVSTSVSPLRTCIKVLSEHTCMERHHFELSFVVCLSLSYTVY